MIFGKKKLKKTLTSADLKKTQDNEKRNEIEKTIKQILDEEEIVKKEINKNNNERLKRDQLFQQKYDKELELSNKLKEQKKQEKEKKRLKERAKMQRYFMDRSKKEIQEYRENDAKIK